MKNTNIDMDFARKIEESKNRICSLTRELELTYKTTYRLLLSNFLVSEVKDHITNVAVTIGENSWKITYEHNDLRSFRDYKYEEESDNEETIPIIESKLSNEIVKTNVEFGFDSGYFLRSDSGRVFTVIKRRELVVVDQKFVYDMSIEELSILSKNYEKNQIPEYLAIAFFMKLSTGGWSPSDVCLYFSL